MPDTPPNINALRHQLMRVGGSFTMIMANSGVLPEDVATRVALPLPVILNIMNGTHMDVQVSQMANVAQALGTQLMLGIQPIKPPVDPSAVPATPVISEDAKA